MWTLAKVRNGFHDLPNERFHTFAVKRDGEIIGELKFDRGRWKSAGGPAWKGTIFNSSKHHGMNVSFHDKNKQNVLDWFKQYFIA